MVVWEVLMFVLCVSFDRGFNIIELKFNILKLCLLVLLLGGKWVFKDFCLLVLEIKFCVYFKYW